MNMTELKARAAKLRDKMTKDRVQATRQYYKTDRVSKRHSNTKGLNSRTDKYSTMPSSQGNRGKE